MKTRFLGNSVFGVAVYRWIALAVLLALLLLLSDYIRERLEIEWTMESLRYFVQSLGAWGPLSYIGILIFRFLFLIPSGLLLLAAGILFGPLYGTIYAGLGLFGSALWKYAMVSIVGCDIVSQQLPPKLQLWVVGSAQRKASLWALLGICAYPFVPKHIFQFAAILSGMKLAAYVTAVSAGSFVRAGIFASFGEALYAKVGLASIGFSLVVLLGTPLCVKPWRHQLMEPLQLSISTTKSRSKP